MRTFFLFIVSVGFFSNSAFGQIQGNKRYIMDRSGIYYYGDTIQERGKSYADVAEVNLDVYKIRQIVKKVLGEKRVKELKDVTLVLLLRLDLTENTTKYVNFTFNMKGYSLAECPLRLTDKEMYAIQKQVMKIKYTSAVNGDYLQNFYTRCNLRIPIGDLQLKNCGLSDYEMQWLTDRMQQKVKR